MKNVLEQELVEALILLLHFPRHITLLPPG